MCRLCTLCFEVIMLIICLIALALGFVAIVVMALYLDPYGGLPHAPPQYESEDTWLSDFISFVTSAV